MRWKRHSMASGPILLSLASLAILQVSAARGAGDPSMEVSMAPAPMMESAQVVRDIELGKYDDAYADGGLDGTVARLGNDWFKVVPGPEPALKKIATMPDSNEARIVGGVRIGERQWVFVEGGKRRSFVLDASSGDLVEFAIPGVEPPGHLGTQIQSWVIARGTPAAVFMISGGERWPRDGNRPLYFWMDLKSGKIACMPVGWDLHSFSADEKMAFFANGAQGVDMTTGRATDTSLDSQQGIINFNWTRKPLDRIVVVPGQDGIRGFSIDGAVERLKEPFNGGADNAQSDGQWVACGGGEADLRAQNRLWLASLKTLEGAEPIKDGVMEHAMLGNGEVLMRVRGKATQPISEPPAEALVYQASNKHAWNLLDGLEDFAPLPPGLAGKDFVQDSRNIRFVRSGGGPGPVLCVVDRQRMDLRAGVIQSDAADHIPRQHQRWSILVMPGHRYLVDLFASGNTPDGLWLDPSGAWVIARQGSGDLQLIQLQLSNKAR